MKGAIFVHNSQSVSSLQIAGKLNKTGYTPRTALSLDLYLESPSNVPPSYDPFDYEERDYRHYLMKRALRRVIRNELSEDQRECLKMRYVLGMSVSEIALQRGVRASTVSKHISKAELTIKRILGYLFESEV